MGYPGNSHVNSFHRQLVSPRFTSRSFDEKGQEIVIKV